MLNLKPAKQGLIQQDDVLSQQPLAVSPHFFSLKAPDQAEHEIVPLPSRIAPAAYADPVRAHVSTCLVHKLHHRKCQMW